jgi:Flp pilus assembly protein TadG
MIRLPRLVRRLDERGASTIEFAVVVPAFLMMAIGGMHLSMLGFTASSLHYAAEHGARCGAVQTTRCTSATSAQDAATAAFQNITGGTATFTATPTATCGYQLVGTVTYAVQTGFSTLNVPLSATACYPT